MTKAKPMFDFDSDKPMPIENDLVGEYMDGGGGPYYLVRAAAQYQHQQDLAAYNLLLEQSKKLVEALEFYAQDWRGLHTFQPSAALPSGGTMSVWSYLRQFDEGHKAQQALEAYKRECGENGS